MPKRDTIDGTKGFSPQLAGHGKDGKSNTSSFDSGPPDYTMPGYPSGKENAPPHKDVGLEEGGRNRQPTTSVMNDPGKKHNN
jgi:hypothetical protein